MGQFLPVRTESVTEPFIQCHLLETECDKNIILVAQEIFQGKQRANSISFTSFFVYHNHLNESNNHSK